MIPVGVGVDFPISFCPKEKEIGEDIRDDEIREKRIKDKQGDG